MGAQPVRLSFFDTVKEWFTTLDIDAWLAQMGIAYTVPVQGALCFGSGFAIGFLFKKYFKFLILCTVVTAVVIKVFEYHDVITIDWESFRLLFGFPSDLEINDVLTYSFDWMKAHLVIVICSLGGFLFGYKLG